MNDTLLIVHARTLPTDEDWAALMRCGEELGARMRRCLIFADVSLTAKQRREIAEVIKRAQTQVVVVVTRSTVTRMIVTGLGWMTGIHSAFDVHDLDGAFERLAVAGDERSDRTRCAQQLAERLGDEVLAQELAKHLPARSTTANSA